MKLQNFTLKIIATTTLMFVAYAIQAQDQTITLGDPTVFNYVADTDPANGGQSPDGTPSSTYDWSVDTAIAILNVTGGNSNKATIDWSAVAVGTYHIQVIETNATCPSDPIEFIIEIVLPGNPVLTWVDSQAICTGEDATFNITSAPTGSIINYTATGGTPVSGTVTVNSSGEATIVVTHDGSASQIVVNLTSMDVGGNNIPFSPEITATATVNIVETSPIQLVP